MSRQPTFPDHLLAWWWRRGWRGFLTLQRGRHLFGGDQRVLHRTPFGSLFLLDPRAYIDGIVLREGYYESEVLEALRPFLTPGAVLWDIGGNFGLHAVTAARLHPAARVFAFEPNPVMIAAIEEHARLNGVAVSVLPVALAAESGPRTFHVNAVGNPGMSSLHAWPGAQFDHQITVACERADALVARGLAPAPTVIKLDVEGGEPSVLAGLGELLRQPTLRAVVFEGPAGLATNAPSDPVADPLRAAGFTLRSLNRREATDHALENYVATRSA